MWRAEWHFISAMAGVAVLFFGGVLIADQGFSEVTAAWVQALGSIAAILASTGIAIWVDRRGSRRQQEERVAARFELLEVMWEISDGAIADAERIRLAIARSLEGVVEFGVREQEALEDAALMLELLDIGSLKSPRAHRYWLELIKECRLAGFYVSRAAGDYHTDRALNEETAEDLQRWPGRIASLRDQICLLRDETHRSLPRNARPSEVLR